MGCPMALESERPLDLPSPARTACDLYAWLSALSLVLAVAYPAFPLAIPCGLVFMLVASVTVSFGESYVRINLR